MQRRPRSLSSQLAGRVFVALLAIAGVGAPAQAQVIGGVVPIPGTGGTEQRHRTIFLNRDGGTYGPPTILYTDNSSTNESYIVQHYAGRAVDISPAPYDDAQWQAILGCMQAQYDRFDATVTDEDPGSARHIEVVFARHPRDVGIEDDNVAGIAAVYGDCSVVERAVAFVFTDNVPSPERACQTAAHEAGHSLGLDHSRDCDDPMSYCSRDGAMFVEGEAMCGEYDDRECRCGERQDTAGHLRNRLGAGEAYAEPPRVSFTDLGPTVPSGAYDIEVEVAGGRPIRRVELAVDRDPLKVRYESPWVFSGTMLRAGNYEITARAVDGWNTVGETSLALEVEDDGDGDGDGDGDEQVPDAGTPGGPDASDNEPEEPPPPSGGCHAGTAAAPGGALVVVLAMLASLLWRRRCGR